MDVAVRENFTDRIHVLPGLPDNEFGLPITTSTGREVRGEIATGDMNKDGIPDIVAASAQSQNRTLRPLVTVLLGNGNGTFRVHTRYELAGNPSDVIIDDFNHDGNPDTAVGRYGALVLLLGDGQGNVAQKSDNVFPTYTAEAATWRTATSTKTAISTSPSASC